MLISCEDNKLCWLEANLWQYIDPWQETSENFNQLFFSVCAMLYHDQRSLFCMHGAVEPLEEEE